MAETKTRHNEKSWREYIVDNVGLGISRHVDFDDTNPNYAIISNPCDSPLYVSTSPKVSDKVADLVIPPKGRQIYAQMHGMRELHFMCYDGVSHSVTVKSWEGEFSPSAIPQSQQFSVVDEKQSLGTVEVSNLPNVQTVAVNNIPDVQTVSVNNMPAKQSVSVADKLPAGDNNIGRVTLDNGSGISPAIISQFSSQDGYLSVANTLLTGSMLGAYNGTSWDRWRNNQEGILLASSPRSATTNTGAQTNHNARGIILTIDITALTTGSIQPYIYGVDPVTGTTYALHSGVTAFNTVGKNVLVLYPTTGTVGGHVKSFINGILPKKFYMAVVHGDSTPVTYSMSYSLIL